MSDDCLIWKGRDWSGLLRIAAMANAALCCGLVFVFGYLIGWAIEETAVDPVSSNGPILLIDSYVGTAYDRMVSGSFFIIAATTVLFVIANFIPKKVNNEQ